MPIPILIINVNQEKNKIKYSISPGDVSEMVVVSKENKVISLFLLYESYIKSEAIYKDDLRSRQIPVLLTGVGLDILKRVGYTTIEYRDAKGTVLLTISL